MDINTILQRVESGESTVSDAEAIRQYLATLTVRGVANNGHPTTISDWVRACGQLAERKGFDLQNVDQQLLLIISEVVEAHDAYRNRSKLGERFMGMFAEELADVVIRLFSFAYGQGIDLEAAITAKHERNKHRPWRHSKDF